ncbi:MAG TPA: sialidase family protein [Alphaproteobacteria bacterium]|nr:sialidase family protein [Alphaproteobacteria bacterium]
MTIPDKNLITIASDPPYYHAWPGLARLRNGELWCVFSGNRDNHVCPYGRIMLTKSYDDGLHWTEPLTIMSTPLDDRDPAIIELDQGAIMVTWFSFDTGRRLARYRDYYPRSSTHWERHLSKVSREDRLWWHQAWLTITKDLGKTWDQPHPTHVHAPHGPIQLGSGELLYVGNKPGYREVEVYLGSDAQDFRAFDRIGGIFTPDHKPGVAFSEPHVVELVDASLLCVLRRESRDDDDDKENRYLWISSSMDGGRHWGAITKSTMRGYPGHILRCSDGRLIVSAASRTYPYSVHAYSIDAKGAVLFHEEIYRDIPSPDMGYPVTVELAPGEYLTAFYTADLDGSSRICGARWESRWQ